MRQFFGKYRGKVTATQDPLHLVQVPAIFGEGRHSWTMPCTPYAGRDIGLANSPATTKLSSSGIELSSTPATVKLTPAAIELSNSAANVKLSPVSVNVNNGALEVI